MGSLAAKNLDYLAHLREQVGVEGVTLFVAGSVDDVKQIFGK